MHRKWVSGVFVLAAMVLVGTHSLAQESPTFVVETDFGVKKMAKTFSICSGDQTVTPEQLLAQYAHVTGKRFIYNPRMFRGREVTLKGAGSTTFKIADADRVFQGILRNNGLAMAPLAGEGLSTYSIEMIDSSRILKVCAQAVSPQEAMNVMNRPAEVFMAALPLRHVTVSHVRQALQNLVQTRTAEFIQEIQGANTLMICGFGTTVSNVARLVRMLDVPSAYTAPGGPGTYGYGGRTVAPRPSRPSRTGGLKPPGPTVLKKAKPKPSVYLVRLKHAKATDALCNKVTKGKKDTLRAIPDQRTNSIILFGSKLEIKKARKTIQSLDKASYKKNRTTRIERQSL